MLCQWQSKHVGSLSWWPAQSIRWSPIRECRCQPEHLHILLVFELRHGAWRCCLFTHAKQIQDKPRKDDDEGVV